MQVHATSEKSDSASFVNRKKQQPFFAPAYIQPKLTVGPVDDPYEREADAMADKVMRMSDNETLQTKLSPVSVQRKCEHCEEEEKLQRKESEEEDAEMLQMKPIADLPVQRKCAACEQAEKIQKKGSSANASPAVSPAVHQTLQSSGQPMDKSTRSFMESRFGYDFGNVQIHDDHMAHQSSKGINALAYTHGHHVVFGSGQYQPNTNSGKQLLAHELTHVVQQDLLVGKIQRMGLTDEEDAIRRKTVSGDHFISTPLILYKAPEIIQRQAAPPPLAPVPVAHPKALDAVSKMADFMTNENIIFDYWAGDCRDNNKNGLTDNDDVHYEQNQDDGTHYSGTYPGFKTIAGYDCIGGWGGNQIVSTDANITTRVKYRVCADVISQAYTNAGIAMGHRRSVGGIIAFFKNNKHCTFWEIASFPGPFLPGDLLCSFDGQHGHSGMVTASARAGSNPDIIHLPGQSQLLKMGINDPLVTNDLRMEPWWPFRPQYGVGRYTG